MLEIDHKPYPSCKRNHSLGDDEIAALIDLGSSPSVARKIWGQSTQRENTLVFFSRKGKPMLRK